LNTQTFEELVKEKITSLSSGQKKVAEYLAQRIEEAAISTAVQIGRNVGVSETTVIRLSYALGFKGFSEMQGYIQKQVLQQNHFPVLSNHLLNEEGHRQETQNPFTTIVEQEMCILQENLQPKNLENIWKAVDALIRADQILVVGYRVSYAAAYWFSYMLGTLRPNVRLCPQAGEAHEILCDLTPQSVTFCISFPRYVKETVQLAECAKQIGIPIISATDRLLSPVGEISDITLITEENVKSGSNSIASVISLLDLVIVGMNLRNAEHIQARQQKLEKLYAMNTVYME
jgi:DNA-binding MurR/RpiR family transcriptional regulator